MARSGSRGVLIAVVVFVALAVLVRLFGGPLFDLFVTMHGGGGGGH